jgi:hypothetical protein
MSIWVGEPRLSELLADPILQLRAACDGVSVAELRRLVAEVMERRNAAAREAEGHARHSGRSARKRSISDSSL